MNQNIKVSNSNQIKSLDVSKIEMNSEIKNLVKNDVTIELSDNRFNNGKKII